MLNTNDEKVIGALIFLLKEILRWGDAMKSILDLGFVHKLAKILDISNNELSKEIIYCLIELSAISSEAIETMLRLNVHKRILSLLNTEDEEYVENVSFVVSVLVFMAINKYGR